MVPSHACAHCGLTPRSTGAQTAGHQRPGGGTRYIFTARALVACRCRPVSSNVRPPSLRMRSVGGSASHCGSRLESLPQVSRHALNTACVGAYAPTGASVQSVFRGATAYSKPLRLRLTTPALAVAQHTNSLHGFAGVQPSSRRPNPSVKPRPNGGPPGPGHRYGVHFLWPGPGVPPSVPAYLER